MHGHARGQLQVHFNYVLAALVRQVKGHRGLFAILLDGCRLIAALNLQFLDIIGPGWHCHYQLELAVGGF